MTDTTELVDALRRLQNPKHSYDPEAELLEAGLFVAQFGPLGELFNGPGERFTGPALTDVQTWNGPADAALTMLGHWSVSRGDPDPDYSQQFDHGEACPNCRYLEQVFELRAVFLAHQVCDDCGLEIDQHDIGPDAFGNAHAYCRQLWIRMEPAVAPGGDVSEGQVYEYDGKRVESWNARWYANTRTPGEYALITQTFYLGQEFDTGLHEYAGDVLMFCETEYMVCTDVNDPGNTEINAEYITGVVDCPETMDPRQTALAAEEPHAGDWYEHAPAPFKEVLAAVAA